MKICSHFQATTFFSRGLPQLRELSHFASSLPDMSYQTLLFVSGRVQTVYGIVLTKADFTYSETPLHLQTFVFL